MKRNIGSADKIVRLCIVLIAAVLYFADVLNGIVLSLLLGVFALTALVNICPLYRLLGINTHRPDKKH